MKLCLVEIFAKEQYSWEPLLKPYMPLEFIEAVQVLCYFLEETFENILVPKVNYLISHALNMITLMSKCPYDYIR